MTCIRFPGSLCSSMRILEGQVVKMRPQHRIFCKNKCSFETIADPISRLYQISIWIKQFFCHFILQCLITMRWGNASFFRLLQSPVLLIWQTEVLLSLSRTFCLSCKKKKRSGSISSRNSSCITFYLWDIFIWVGKKIINLLPVDIYLTIVWWDSFVFLYYGQVEYLYMAFTAHVLDITV